MNCLQSVVFALKSWLGCIFFNGDHIFQTLKQRRANAYNLDLDVESNPKIWNNIINLLTPNGNHIPIDFTFINSISKIQPVGFWRPKIAPKSFKDIFLKKSSKMFNPTGFNYEHLKVAVEYFVYNDLPLKSDNLQIIHHSKAGSSITLHNLDYTK